jgi:transposase
MTSDMIVVSAKISKRLKKEIEKRGLKMSDAIRRGLENELKEAKVGELEAIMEKVDLKKLSDEDIVRDIRRTRDEH